MTKKQKTYKNKFEQMLAYGLEGAVLRAFLNHVAEGHALHSFYYVGDGFRIAYHSIEPYLKKNPDIFPLEEIEFAKAQGYKKWERIVFDASLGKYQGHSAPLLQMIMRNKYKWDSKEEEKSQEPIHVSVNMVPKKK